MAAVAYTVVAFQPSSIDYDVPMMSRIVTVIIGLAAFAAAVISFNLTIKHIHGTTGLAWFESVCSAAPGAETNCAKVLKSPYSYLPPKHGDEPNGFHLPASFLGLIYYSTILLWIIGVGRPSPGRRWVHAIPLTGVGIGLAFSAWFLYVMYGKIGEWCAWCLGTHVLNVVIALGLLALWPRRGRVESSIVDGDLEAGTESFRAHPTNRLISMTLLSIILMTYGHLFFFEWRGKIRDSKQLMDQIDVLRSNVGGFIAQWQVAPVCKQLPRPNDAVQNFADGKGSDATLDIVIFSDFECPGCAKYAEFFDKNIPPLFDNNIRLTFRHSPWDQSCNPRSSKTIHPHACAAAILAEAARELGGTEAFWKAHDFLFEHRNEIAAGTMSAERLAPAIGVEASALAAAAQSGEHAARIAQDIDQGAACGVRATPTVLVDGKRVENAATSNMEFWDKLADWYWKEKAKKDRPASTRRPPSQPHP